jgi:AraC-like DNA-binding protein
VTDVCFAVGCTSLGSFSARFTELVGETPSMYRARSHDELRGLSPCQAMVQTRPRRAGGKGSGRNRAVSEKRSAVAPA